MSGDTGKLGQSGESMAVSHLKKLGFTILQTNYRCRTAEIDIIAKDIDTLCFIEVKTRSSLKKGLPRESVTYGKQQKILMGAAFYMKEQKIPPMRTRFDVVEIIKNTSQSSWTINLIKNAFIAG